MTVLQRILLGMVAALVVGIAAVLVTYGTIPLKDTDQTHFDAVIVLGSPADPDGKASVEQTERVMEGVREFRAGRAGHLIVTGGASHNQWVEGEVEARLADAAGVPANDVLVEGQSINTIENLYYSHKIMKREGWSSAEVVSSPSHLRRTSLILAKYQQAYGMQWSTHASHWPETYKPHRLVVYWVYEAVGTTILRWFGFRDSRFLPPKLP